MDKKINDFIVFCLESYKSKYNIKGYDAYNLFKEYGLFDYLKDGYDVLHTQGQDYIINDIEIYLENRKDNFEFSIDK